MMHQQIQVQMHSLPISLILIAPSGKIGFTKLAPKFGTVFDIPEQPGGIHAVVSDEDLLVNDEVYQYGAAYPLTETMKEWLRSLELSMSY